MRKSFIFLLIVFLSWGVLYSKYAVVNLKVLFFLHPKMQKFSFSERMFPWVTDLLNRQKEELKRLESLYQSLMEKESLLKQKLEREKEKLKKKEITQEEFNRQSKKIENTIIWSKKKREALEHKMDSYRDSNYSNIKDKLYAQNFSELQSVLEEVKEYSVKYALRHGYSGLFNISEWLGEIYFLKNKWKSNLLKEGGFFINNYFDFKEKGKLEDLNKWYRKGLYLSVANFSGNESFILYGGDNITWRVFRELNNKYKRLKKGEK